MRHDVVSIARDLIGKVLVTSIDNIYTSGIITETEAYNGIYDRACHAFNGRRTARNEMMYGQGGNAYIYLCYGIHHLFNVVTNEANIPDAILIRAVYPLDGVKHFLNRRKMLQQDKRLSAGPGTVSQSLGMDISMSGTSLIRDKIFIEDRGICIESKEITVTPRIGVESSGEAALLPFRFVVGYSYFNEYSADIPTALLKKKGDK